MPSAKSLPSASRPKALPRLFALLHKQARACDEAHVPDARLFVPWDEVSESERPEVEAALVNGLLRPEGKGRRARLVPTDRLTVLLCELAVKSCAADEALLGAAEEGPRPSWKDRELRLGDVLVKRLDRPAPSQECVLQAFQDAGWPPRIACPKGGTKKWRRETVASLNDRHEVNVLRFRVSDGDFVWVRVERRGRACTGPACASAPSPRRLTKAEPGG
jgi:hypothetical protein